MKRKSLSSLTLTCRQLKLWAEWCQAITTQGLDYSNQSILANLVKYGGFISKSTAPNPYFLNRKAEAVNELIEKLGGLYRDRTYDPLIKSQLLYQLS